MPVSHARACLYTVRPIGFFALAYALVALSGYQSGESFLYRPFDGGPATHPMTALLVLLLGAALMVSGVFRLSRAALGLAGLAALLAAGRLFGGNELIAEVSPFEAVVAAERAAGLDNSMGVNTALMMLAIAVSVVLRQRRHFVFSQVAGFVAIALPMISLTGYAYGIEAFYGQMSFVTLSLGLPLALAATFATSHRGILRALLTPYVGGRIARRQLIAGYLFPFVVGFVAVKARADMIDSDLYGVLVVLTCWFIVGLITISAVYQEKTDRQRRGVERALRVAAMTDGLTGLHNRRFFVAEGRRQLARDKRSGLESALLLIDIDRFKQVNDTGGHATGDRVLVAVAQTLKAGVRGGDYLARYGGEEFSLMLHNTDLATAVNVAEQIRHRIGDMAFPPWPGHDGRITVSIGVAGGRTFETLEDLTHAADTALYRAKSEGRNRVEAEAPPLSFGANSTSRGDFSRAPA